MEYEQILDGLVGPADLATEDTRRAAYLRCLEYADRAFPDALDYNPFVALAAERLGQPAVFRNVASAVTWTGGEHLHLRYSGETGPVLTGNPAGFRWLAGVLERLARSTMAGEHVLLRAREAPLAGDSYPLSLYMEGDQWFTERARADSPSPTPAGRPRPIRAEDVEAFRATSPMPPPLMMTPGRVYRVLGCTRYTTQQVWRKDIRSETERLYVFSFERDDGRVQELALDLDDESIDFLTARG